MEKIQTEKIKAKKRKKDIKERESESFFVRTQIYTVGELDSILNRSRSTSNSIMDLIPFQERQKK